ncbi:hypothetical protein [Phenylobacterium montanum]|uniref:Uncharacterized protein n=1 Tax=Phenylobacterium montanum TaxID=2823693 RepID=A0A975FZB0_9CAUL|nr:hypothetical protein [Caulobacter sp. S6]QUD87612.1 hypothetical protein KCG34_21590 [Caulobacter sp. S6]
MTRLSVSYPQAPERRDPLAVRAFRLVWSLTCWTAVATIAVTLLAALER